MNPRNLFRTRPATNQCHSISIFSNPFGVTFPLSASGKKGTLLSTTINRQAGWWFQLETYESAGLIIPNPTGQKPTVIFLELIIQKHYSVRLPGLHGV